MTGPDRRDLAIEALLRGGTAAPPVDERVCLDAETLAAWLDGGLPAAARASIDEHVATCARCQVLVGAMARTEPVGVPAATAERAWFRWWVPLTAAAAALVLWAVVPRDTPPAPAEQLSARAEPVAPPAVEQTPAAPLAVERAPVAPPADASALRPAAPPSAANLQPPRGDERARDSASLADQAAPKAAQSDASAREAGGAAASREARVAAAPPPPAPPAPAAAAMARAFSPEATVTSVDGAVRWGLAGDAVSKSVAGGARTPVISGGGRSFTAGAAPSADVCWLVGRAGLVMRTVDGRNFETIPFPQAADLAAVSAQDANRATVTTSAGQSFSTTDGGLTWRP